MSPVPRSPTTDSSPSSAGPAAEVLIVDNDQSHAETVAESLDRAGFRCCVATSGSEGARLVEEREFDAILTDLKMNDVDGLQILERAKSAQPDTEVILLTGFGSIPSAVEAMQKGAFNYLTKPLDINQLRAATQRAVDSSRLRRTNLELNRRLDEKFGFEGVIGDSRQMRDIIERLKRIAPTNATLLIQGETGTGKELVAQAVHQNSPRKNKPFVALNCAALSENILESELFGHVKGAFTDASADRVGKFEYAHGGTLFLDEVGDMPLATQIKLLRVLENGEITRVGSNDPIKVNVRILSATNRNLEDAIEAGTFRSDLYHRLKVVTIRLPSLRERSQDIPMLIDYFLKQFAAQHGKRIRGMSAAARHRLLDLRVAGQRPPASQRGGKHGRGRLRRPVGHRRPARRTGRSAGAFRRTVRLFARRPGRPDAGRDREAVHRRDPAGFRRQPRIGRQQAGNRRADAVSEDQGVWTVVLELNTLVLSTQY